MGPLSCHSASLFIAATFRIIAAFCNLCKSANSRNGTRTNADASYLVRVRPRPVFPKSEQLSAHLHPQIARGYRRRARPQRPRTRAETRPQSDPPATSHSSRVSHARSSSRLGDTPSASPVSGVARHSSTQHNARSQHSEAGSFLIINKSRSSPKQRSFAYNS